MNVQLHQDVREGSAKRNIWKIADELFSKRGKLPSGKEVVERYAVEFGGNEGTAWTQFSRWKQKARNLEAHRTQSDLSAAPGSVEAITLSVTSNGTLKLPMELLNAMALGSDGRVTARVENGKLMIVSPKAAIREAQEWAKQFKKPGESVVDEFLAERRSLWGEE